MHPVHVARRLAAALEPVIGAVFFLPENHDAYAALGFGPSPRSDAGVARPDGPAYVASRASCLGSTGAPVVAAAFGVFSPRLIDGALAAAVDVAPDELAEVRLQAAASGLERILGPADARVDEVAQRLGAAVADLGVPSRALYAGLRGLPPVTGGWAGLHRAGDLAREYRGDCHNIAWSARGLGACEIGLLTELWWGLPARSYVRSRGWTDADLDAASQRLETSGLLDGEELTTAGRELRESIEQDTDRQCEPLVAALGDDIEELIATLRGWSKQVQAGFGYPANSPLDVAD